MKSLRRRVLLASFCLIAVIWSLIAALLLYQPNLSSLSLQWLQSKPEANQTFFYLAGFHAAEDADPKLYGEYRWQRHTEFEPSAQAVQPSRWQFGLPCRLSQVECLQTLKRQQAQLRERLRLDQLWLARWQTLLEWEAPHGPIEPGKDRFGSLPRQLVSAFELQLVSYFVNLLDADPVRQTEIFQTLNQQLLQLISHIEKTNLVTYRKFLLNAFRSKLAWLVAQLQLQPELKAIAAQNLQVLSLREQLSTPMGEVLRREFVHSNEVYRAMEQQGVSQALGWQLKVSSLFQTMTWQKNRTLNALSENYQYALELQQGQHGLDSLTAAAEQWPEQESLWREDNLIGALLLKEKLSQLSSLLKTSFLTDAYYAVTRIWLLHRETELPKTVDLYGAQVEVQQRPLEQRLCLQLPKVQSLDEACVRLFQSP